MMAASLPGQRARSFHIGDLPGAGHLLLDATVGLVDLIEAMHHTIVARAPMIGAAPEGSTKGITGLVYGAIRDSARVAGQGLSASWDALGLPPPDEAAPQRETLLAAINGLWGDHLERTRNSLAIPISFRVDGRRLKLTADGLRETINNPSSRLLVLLHGLCMNDLQWTRQGHDHGRALSRDLGFSPVYLHYNSGRHVSENGSDFSAMLELLVANWPVPVDELVIIGHSAGGLVARAACHGAAGNVGWLKRLRSLVCLGTPHHGVPLERGGRLLDSALSVSPYVAPFARLGKARSAGITDLRYGNVQKADWAARDRHDQRRDDRIPTPLPAGVQVCFVAATLAKHTTDPRSYVVGDGLVPMPSALGEHADPRLALMVPETNRYVEVEANHFDLLSRADVYTAIRGWLIHG